MFYLVLHILFASAASASSYAKYVNLFIGTEGSEPGTSFNGGNVFPGATYPFGAVKAGIDTAVFNNSIEANAGYTAILTPVTAITLLHESGTGGAPKYGVIGQMPLTSLEDVNVLDNITYMQPRTQRDHASIGHYVTNLQNGVQVDVSVSMHAGLLQYSFPGDGGKHVLVDLSHYLPTQGESSAGQFYSNGQIDVMSDVGMYSGYGIYRGGWNDGPDYTVYFCAEFDTIPQQAQIFFGPYTDPYWPNSTSARATFVDAISHASRTGGTIGWDYADRIGALFTFPENSSIIKSKMGVSWISVDKACEFLGEIPGWDINNTAQEVVSVWDEQILNKIQVSDDTNETLLEIFYSALYRTSILPSNRTGENPYWDDNVGYVDDIYTAWDTFRCWNSLQHLINPDLATAFVNTLIGVWRHERFMPDGRSANYNGRVQGGSNADNILADAYVKGLGMDGSINWTAGYQAMLQDAEVTPYNTFDPEDLTCSTKEGRGALPDWLEYGYVTPNYGRCLSKTVEYSLNDFSVAQVARGEAPQDVAKYLNRSAGWQKIWSNNVSSLGFSGFLAPTYANGSIMANNGSTYSPLTCGACEWDAISYEALPWEYSWTVPFDMETLIQFMGGINRTEQRLDTMFIPGLKTTGTGTGGTNGIGTTIFNPGNEPSFATPYLYNYLPGRQFKSVLRGRETVYQYYNTGPSGIPGNSDAGALDSWLVWQMLGLYPVVTQPVYLILSPWFNDITMSVGKDKFLRITAANLDNSGGSIYVQSLKVNGQSWNQSWISHDQLMVGNASLEFVLGTQQTIWDIGAVPPSPGHVVLDSHQNNRTSRDLHSSGHLSSAA